MEEYQLTEKIFKEQSIDGYEILTKEVLKSFNVSQTTCINIILNFFSQRTSIINNESTKRQTVVGNLSLSLGGDKLVNFYSYNHIRNLIFVQKILDWPSFLSNVTGIEINKDTEIQLHHEDILKEVFSNLGSMDEK